MRSKLVIGAFILILLSIMNTYSRALRHINIKDVKEKHQQKLIEQKIQEEKKKEEKKYIASVMEEKKYNWRKEFNESAVMTSSGMFTTTLPATGDADLIPVDVSNSSNYASSRNISYGESGVSFNPYGTTPYATTNVIDTSTSDSISFTGFANPNFSTQSDLGVFWYNNDTGQFGDLPSITRTSTSSATYTANLPLAARGKNVDFTFYQPRTSENSSQDFVGKPIYIGGQLASIDPRFTSSLASSIVSLLINYGNPATTNVDLGRSIMFYASQNPSQFPEYESIQGNPYYPGITGPVSGNVGDPNIDGFNGDLSLLKNQSGAFVLGYLTYDTTIQDIEDRFVGTDLNTSQFFLNLQSARYYGNLYDTYNSSYNQYYSSNPTLANYYLGLANEASSNQTTYLNQMESQLDAASTLPDSAWTDADYERVAVDIYNLYKDTKTYTITNLSTKRRAPMNVFVPLDSPEATAFIRTDPMMSNLSPEERKQKLKEMLEASDEYVMKMLGVDFPGTGSVPPGEYDPFAQAPPGEAGDTPGVEIAGLPSLPAGPSGFDRKPGSYHPNNIIPIRSPGSNYRDGEGFNMIDPFQNSPQTRPGLSKSGNKNNQIAQNWTDDPSTWPSIKNPVKSAPAIIDPKTGWPSVPNVPPSYKGKPGGTKLKLAHYELEGELISEKKKLKSPEEVLNKIPGYYDGKPSPLGFPVEPPPKMVNGMHPDLVDGKKVADRFNRLDPISAKAMPPTGNPHIDKKVRAARKKPK